MRVVTRCGDSAPAARAAGEQEQESRHKRVRNHELGPAISSYEKNIMESLILAQNERWRRG